MALYLVKSRLAFSDTQFSTYVFFTVADTDVLASRTLFYINEPRVLLT